VRCASSQIIERPRDRYRRSPDLGVPGPVGERCLEEIHEPLLVHVVDVHVEARRRGHSECLKCDDGGSVERRREDERRCGDWKVTRSEIGLKTVKGADSRKMERCGVTDDW